ncbi:cytochrome c biogenesis CcdA family protein [Solwaraspora sp. WMMD1047]|uniref:cytochrome c biogenesis CcdA family protein n=1 Tax=Solwaraspora sp. WMMD1047 TaxID=3016102 RepID=UPI0024160B67|nr:cytochrome c biogenesis CcdA family protein [Solwaraspora sp. WMMD1047]MDG4827906.1 cytochrome c biogenesis CcdA family protein [Solwaraspora sp. WMMD1047]
MGEAFAELARGGPLLLAFGAAALAGLVSFLSPCILPLVPGYLSYVTGLAGSQLDVARAAPPATGTETAAVGGGPPADDSADAAGTGTAGGVAVAGGTAGVAVGGGTAGVAVAGGSAPAGGGAVAVAERPDQPAVRGRVLAGTLLFVAGFTVVFTLTAIFFSTIGRVLFTHRRPLEIGAGLLVIVLGLAFLGLVPGMAREFRIRRLPAAGLLGAPVFGATFALSWMPCVGPTLGAVLMMATVSGKTDRAVLLAVAYCLGLGLPFVVFGLAFERLLGVFRAVRRNSRWVTRLGGALLILVGLALVSGAWQSFLAWLQPAIGATEVVI